MEEEWFSAARNGDDKRVAKLLAEQPNLIEAKIDRTQDTALHLAVEAGHEAVVARLLAARPELLHARDILNWTALDLAASNGDGQMVAQMLATEVVGLDISVALWEAIRKDHPDVVNLLLAARSAKALSCRCAGLALSSMIVKGEQENFTKLFAICPRVIVEEFGCNIWCETARYGRDDMLLQVLTLHPQMIDAVNYNSHNLLMCALEGDHQHTAETLLAIKPELILYVSKWDANTVLHHAIKCKDPEFVAKLWRLNPQALTHTNINSETPFHLAVSFAKDKLIERFQWSLPFDDIVNAFTRYQIDWQERYRPVMEQLLSESSLSVSLNRDVVGTVLEYVGIDVAQRVNKRTKFS